MPARAALATFLSLSIAAGKTFPGERDFNGYTYDHYLEEFGKKDSNSVGSKQAFVENMERIRRQNEDPEKTWFATVNEFTDWTNEEFRALRHGRISQPFSLLGSAAKVAEPSVALADLPDSMDWRAKEGVVTPAKNQGGCGSCWAFSTVETLESHLAIATGQPAPVLSPQQVVSCAPNPQHCGGTGGCAGSTQPLGFNYTESAGITLESDYPYTGETGTCEKSKIKPVAKNTGYVQLPANDYTALMTAVATKGPVAISLAAGAFAWQLYGGGVYDGKGCGWDEDHAVQLVGYGQDGDKMYWIVRNSWGPGWGEKGFMRLARFGEGKEPCGTDDTPQHGDACEGDTKPRKLCGMCGIMSDSSYPTGVQKASEEALVV
eukprot:TRINITY_DN53993_c0_g1_i1.p1 TRINITY_DN53993_c0_g1~~TRINITY_DN53993_c0_g1_i1.p1  ORF type:complete len:376 (-),score=68.99 TRINITY_DN53993_c0_g1_i1:52-1179(-)